VVLSASSDDAMKGAARMEAPGGGWTVARWRGGGFSRPINYTTQAIETKSTLQHKAPPAAQNKRRPHLT
jgi:hypothetical protein